MKKKRIRVALLIDKSGNYDRGLIRGIIKYAHLSSPWDFFLEAPYYTAKNEKQHLLKKLKAWHPDCIVTDIDFLSLELRSLGVPIFISSSKSLVPDAINIIADDILIGKLGAKHFIDKGYKNFAFYGTDNIFWSKIRKTSFKQSVTSLNFKFFELDALLNNEWQSNPVRVSEWMKTLPVPIAIMACSDDFGTHLIEAARTAEIRIPEEIAILGVDNDTFICDLYDPSMSSIDQESETVGFEVAKAIWLLLREGKQESEYVVGTNYRVVTRRSTDIFAVKDNEILKALQFIKENADKKQITVDDVVAATTLSRRILEMRFRKMLNRSVLQEITRVKMDIICQKLVQTKMPVNEIAYSMGFLWVTSFSSYFKKEKKMTPMEFRRQFQEV